MFGNAPGMTYRSSVAGNLWYIMRPRPMMSIQGTRYISAEAKRTRMLGGPRLPSSSASTAASGSRMRASTPTCRSQGAVLERLAEKQLARIHPPPQHAPSYAETALRGRAPKVLLCEVEKGNYTATSARARSKECLSCPDQSHGASPGKEVAAFAAYAAESLRLSSHA